MMMLADGAKGPVTILGMSFKEDVPDIRNSKVVDIIRELQSFGVAVQVHDPLASTDEARRAYGVTLLPREALQPADVVILAVAHAPFVSEGWPLITGRLRRGSGLVLDVKSRLPRAEQPAGIELWRL
jgi:UDP-N-acetyl-D-galactosamine dehydrogenase